MCKMTLHFFSINSIILVLFYLEKIEIFVIYKKSSHLFDRLTFPYILLNDRLIQSTIKKITVTVKSIECY